MQVKYTKHYLNRLEDVFSETDYILRYEKGNFRSGYCILKEKGLVVVNRYYTMEGKINCLIEILRHLKPSPETLSDKNIKFLEDLLQTEAKS
jgi:repressor of nif and glnA expression